MSDSDSDSDSKQQFATTKSVTSRKTTTKAIKHGDVILLSKNRVAVVKYIGPIPELDNTSSPTSIYYGVEIRMTEKEMGTCNGNIGNKQYFTCPPNVGMFIRHLMIERRISAKELLEKVIKATKSKLHMEQLLQQSITAQTNLKSKLKEMRKTVKKLKRKLCKHQRMSTSNIAYETEETIDSSTFTPRTSNTYSTALELSLLRTNFNIDGSINDPPYNTGIISPSINEHKRNSLQVMNSGSNYFFNGTSVTPRVLTDNEINDERSLKLQPNTPQAINVCNIKEKIAPMDNPILSKSISSPCSTAHAIIDSPVLMMAIPMKAKNMDILEMREKKNELKVDVRNRRTQSSPEMLNKLTPVSYEQRTKEISKWSTDNVLEWLSIMNNEHINILTPPIPIDDDSRSPTTNNYTWITDEQLIWNNIQSIFKLHKINGEKLLQLTDISLLNEMKIDIEDIRYKILFERQRLFTCAVHIQFSNKLKKYFTIDGSNRRSKTNVDISARLKHRLFNKNSNLSQFDSDTESLYSQNIIIDNQSQHTYTQSQSQCRILIGTPPPPPPLTLPKILTNNLQFDELLMVYEMIDKNNDGHICYSDWTCIMIQFASKFDFVLDENDIMSTFDEFDLDSNGVISREEFIAVVAKVYLRSKEEKICNYFITTINHLMRKNEHHRNSSKLKNRNIRRKKHESGGSIGHTFHRRLSINQNRNNRNSTRNKKRRHYISQSHTNNNSPSFSLSSSFSRSCSHSRSRATPVPPPRNSDINQKNYRFKKSVNCRTNIKPRPPPPRFKSASNA